MRSLEPLQVKLPNTSTPFLFPRPITIEKFMNLLLFVMYYLWFIYSYYCLLFINYYVLLFCDYFVTKIFLNFDYCVPITLNIFSINFLKGHFSCLYLAGMAYFSTDSKRIALCTQIISSLEVPKVFPHWEALFLHWKRTLRFRQMTVISQFSPNEIYNHL